MSRGSRVKGAAVRAADNTRNGQSVTELRPEARQDYLQGLLVAVTFAILLAGSNLTSPLLPLYRSALGLTPLMMTITFVTYVIPLIAGLLVLTRPTLIRWAPILLGTALVVCVLADLCLGSVSKNGVLLGRALTGIGGALGTGSASALVVASLGARGRAISATGNLVGAVVGTGLSQLCVSAIGIQAMTIAPHGHAVVCALILIPLAAVLILRRQTNTQAFHIRSHPVPMSQVLAQLWYHRLPVGVGCLSWATLSLTVVWAPTYFGVVGMPLMRSCGLIIFLIASASGQLASPWLTRRMPQMSGMLLIAVGTLAAFGASAIHWPVFAIAGLCALGVGAGLSYRLALVVLTQGTRPVVQGSLASLYSATTYGFAAVSVLISGFWGNAVGLVQAVIAVFSLCALAALAMSWKAPRLYQTNSPSRT